MSESNDVIRLELPSLALCVALIAAGCERTAVTVSQTQGDHRQGDSTTAGGGDEIAIESTAANCSDGVDNDGDGLTDCRDDGCEGKSCAVLVGGPENGFACVGGECRCPGTGEEVGVIACDNGVDDDCDGLTDCDDGNCSQALTCECTPSESAESDCSDGRDTDCDGLTDCQDVDCAGAICRAAGGVCDVAESCDGGACPANGFVSDGIECGARSCSDIDGGAWRMQVCASGLCAGSATVEVCNDDNSCTDDGCAPATGCTHTNNNADCGRTLCAGLTWQQQACSAGTCSTSRPLDDCGDNNPCTDDACDDTTGCSSTNNTKDCGGTFCSALSYRHEVCGGGTCSAWRQVDNCNDSDPCTTDSCGGGGCGNIDNPGCVPCTSPGDCDDGDDCTLDSCGTDGTCEWVTDASQCGMHFSSAWLFGPHPTVGGTTAAADIGPYRANREIWCMVWGRTTHQFYNMDALTVSVGGVDLTQTTLTAAGLDIGYPAGYTGWYGRMASYRLPASSQAAAGLTDQSTTTFTVTAHPDDDSDNYMLYIWYYYVPPDRSYRGIKSEQSADADGVNSRQISPLMVLGGNVAAIQGSPSGSTDILVFSASLATRQDAAPVASSSEPFGGVSLLQHTSGANSTSASAHIPDYVPVGGSETWSYLDVSHAGANGVAMHVVTAAYW